MGLINAAEAQDPATYGSRLYEVITHITKTGHISLITGLIASAKWFESLPEDQRKILREADRDLDPVLPAARRAALRAGGEPHERDRLTRQLIALSMTLTGWIRGGLAQVAILLSALMGGVFGSAVADAAMEARILSSSMLKEGYPKGYTCAAISVGSLSRSPMPWSSASSCTGRSIFRISWKRRRRAWPTSA
jgi:hypothetical protein